MKQNVTSERKLHHMAAEVLGVVLLSKYTKCSQYNLAAEGRTVHTAAVLTTACTAAYYGCTTCTIEYYGRAYRSSTRLSSADDSLSRSSTYYLCTRRQVNAARSALSSRSK